MRIYILIFIASLLSSCSSGFKDEAAFYKWFNNDENGFIKIKVIGDKKISVKYLPPQFLAYKELKNKKGTSKDVKDSLENYYSKSRTFLLKIEPADVKKGGDIQYEDVASFGDYVERTKTLNFDMEGFITLKTDKQELAPVLVNMENTYSVEKGRNFLIVFTEKDKTSDLENSEEFDFILDGELFKTGISHFVFKKKEINQEINLNFL